MEEAGRFFVGSEGVIQGQKDALRLTVHSQDRGQDVFDLLGLTFQGADPAVGGVPALLRPCDHVHHSGVWVWGGLDADAGVGKLAGREGGFHDFLQVFRQGGAFRGDLGFNDARFLVVVPKDVHDAEAYPGFPLLFLFVLIHAFHRLSSGGVRTEVLRRRLQPP